MTTLEVVTALGAALTGALLAWALAVLRGSSQQRTEMDDVRRQLMERQARIAREQDRVDDAIRERVSRLEVLLGVTREGTHTGNGLLARVGALHNQPRRSDR